MATETKTKKKSSKRNYPRKKAHRKIIELTLTDQTTEMLLEQLIMLDKARIRSVNDMQEFVLEKVVERIIEKGNEDLPEALQQTSLTLYSPDGKIRFSVNQQISRNFDDRSHQATALITSFINDHKSTDVDPDKIWLVSMLEAMLFGASRKKQFRHTQELKKFMESTDEELPDDRLIKARDILRKAYYTHRSSWYYHIAMWDDKAKEYIKHEEKLLGNF